VLKYPTPGVKPCPDEKFRDFGIKKPCKKTQAYL
jgi:hypothetical protein